MTERVAIVALTLVPGISGGSENHLRSLCSALARAGRMDYHVYLPSIAGGAGGDLPSSIVGAYAASVTIPGRLAAMTGATLFPWAVSRIITARNPGVVHFPLTIRIPPLPRRAVVTTVHDLQHEVFPSFFSRGELLYRRLVYPASIRYSRRIIAISEHARRSLLERYRLRPETVRTIYNGIDHERFRPGAEERERFILYPANRWPHKNHERLFDAMKILRARHEDVRLVLTGTGHAGAPVPEGVVDLGRVEASELARLYRTAAATVMPSLYEGFGMPVLEAMASGCPVACSNTTALPEVAGDAARLFDPMSPAGIADALADVLEHPERFSQKGIARAALFTWDRAAREHDEIYSEAAGS